jgi:S-disulfanyl-L-cysteine oxidoreductase SoxD
MKTFLVIAALLTALVAIGTARQAPSLKDGVYSNQQAERGRAVYETRCATCHGDKLQGASAGSPLTGPDFLANWSGRPLSDLVDKIHKTMPFEAPGTLSRQQATDLAAHILKTGNYPAGQVDLAEGLMTRVTFPTVERPSGTTASSSVGLPPPMGNLAELMRAIAFYNSNIVFNLQVKSPADFPKKSMPVPYDAIEWGYTIYQGWLLVDQAAVALTETAPLLLTPGRRCQNGLPVPLDRADWKPYVEDVVRVGTKIYAASKARNYEALKPLSDELNTTCLNCHKVYRDNGGSEGSGTSRCRDVR